MAIEGTMEQATIEHKKSDRRSIAVLVSLAAVALGVLWVAKQSTTNPPKTISADYDVTCAGSAMPSVARLENSAPDNSATLSLTCNGQVPENINPQYVEPGSKNVRVVIAGQKPNWLGYGGTEVVVGEGGNVFVQDGTVGLVDTGSPWLYKPQT